MIPPHPLYMLDLSDPHPTLVCYSLLSLSITPDLYPLQYLYHPTSTPTHLVRNLQCKSVSFFSPEYLYVCTPAQPQCVPITSHFSSHACAYFLLHHSSLMFLFLFGRTLSTAEDLPVRSSRFYPRLHMLLRLFDKHMDTLDARSRRHGQPWGVSIGCFPS